MARTIEIPEYLLQSILRHYRALSLTAVNASDTRAYNAKRVARKEIERAEAIIVKQKKT